MAQSDVYQQLAESIGEGQSDIIPRLFEMVANEDEARVLMAAFPAASAPELAEKTGLSPQDVEQMMQPLFLKGLLYRSSRTDNSGNPKYYRVRALLQFHDASVLAPDVDEAFIELWREYQEKEYPGYHKRMAETLPQASMRVIPVNITLQPDSRVAPFEDVKQIVENADSLAVVKCPCRLVAGAPCGKSLEVCIQVNKAADYTMERGSGKVLNKQDALGLLRDCEEEGLVHMVSNRRGLGHIICNCCDDCCIAWPGDRTGPIKYAAPSRFAAAVDQSTCTGCGDCLDRCIFDAIEMDDTAEVINKNCMGCGLCAVVCPVEAISLVEVRDEAHVPE